jgi:hypothetical protein
MDPKQIYQNLKLKGWGGVILVICLLVGCAPVPSAPSPTPTLPPNNWGLSEDEIATLGSLEKVDNYPLYTLRYRGSYDGLIVGANLSAPEVAAPARWGCSLFAALGDPAQRLYGRNFDWRFSPGLLLFTDPPDGYASAAIVDMEYLGFTQKQAQNLTSLPLGELRALLAAPALPFDGMNEMGLAIGMAAVPPGEMALDPNKRTLDELEVMRQILDHAATVDEALEILTMYNIDMGEVPIHYLVASAAGDSALVEFYQGEMVVKRSEKAWQHATNFLVASVGGQTEGQCPRYDRITQRLEETQGQLDIQDALDLLADVSQGTLQDASYTQWSVVYDMTGGDIRVAMGMKYEEAHTLHLDLAGE